MIRRMMAERTTNHHHHRLEQNSTCLVGGAGCFHAYVCDADIQLEQLRAYAIKHRTIDTYTHLGVYRTPYVPGTTTTAVCQNVADLPYSYWYVQSKKRRFFTKFASESRTGAKLACPSTQAPAAMRLLEGARCACLREAQPVCTSGQVRFCEPVCSSMKLWLVRRRVDKQFGKKNGTKPVAFL